MLTLLLACATPTPPPAPPPPPVAASVPSSACAPCHAEAYALWSASHHALAERPASAVGDVGAAPMASGPPLGFERVIGVDPLWQPLVMHNGHLQASSRARDAKQPLWFDIFPDPRAPGDWGHWTGRGMGWDRQCAGCHNTTVTTAWNAGTDRYTTTMAEMAVGCEACHGPSGAHAADPSSPTPGPRDKDAVAETCEACHTRGAPVSDGPRAAAALLDTLLPQLPATDDSFEPNGSVRSEDFEGVAFRLSRMHEAGVRCQDCHVPHSAALRAPGDALCRSCHEAQPQWTEHAHHDAATCVDCHMPTTTYMARDVRHDHRFNPPDPALDQALHIPDACARCHPMDAAKLKLAATWWTPDPATQARTRALAALRADGSTAPAIAALTAETRPMWRAVLLGALADAAPPDQARAAAASENPWLRLAATSALPPDASELRALLTDPLLAVRHAAARALEPALRPDDASLAFHRAFLEARADLPTYAAELAAWWSSQGRADQALPLLQRATRADPANPEHWRNLAVTQAGMGDAPGALASLDRAVKLAPQDADLAFLRGLAAYGLGQRDVARKAFEDARRLNPAHPRASYNLGVLLIEQGDKAGARKVLEQAVKLAPGDPKVVEALRGVTD
jgi:predicted CXXCH cytochrome family protein